MTKGGDEDLSERLSLSYILIQSLYAKVINRTGAS